MTREEAIKRLNSLHYKILHTSFCNKVYQAEIEALVMAKEALEQPKTDWISCEERLPSDTAIHEVTAKFSNGTFYTEFAYYDESREEWWKFDDDGTVNVVAWKEGSEPYKKEGVE